MAGTSESYRKNLEHFSGANEENDTVFNRLSANDQSSYAKFVNRANTYYATARRSGVPAYFKPYIEEVKKVNRSNAPINYEALYAVKSAFGETIWDNDHSALIGVPSSTLPNPRWDVRDYLLGSFEWPRFTRDFRNPTFLRMDQSAQMNHGVGMYLGMSMSFTEIAESGGALWSPQVVLQNQLAQKFGLVKSRRFFLGTACVNGMQDDGNDGADLGITGIYNASGIQTGQTGVGDENITEDGDVEYGLEVGLLPDLGRVYVPHRKVLISTRGYAAETMMNAHRDTYTGVTDFERIVQKFFDTGIISDWIVTDQLYATTSVPTTGQQQAMIICVGEATVHEDIVYPVQTLPLQNTLYPGDLSEVTIFGNIIYYLKPDTTNNAFPATTATGVITSTTTGAWLKQGRLDVGAWRRALASRNA